MLERRELVKELLKDRGNLLVVSGLGSPTYDVAACGDTPLNYYLWGAMGSAAMIGLGLALAKPTHRITVVTGDGEALMGLGALATIAVKQPANLVIVVLDNQHYGETGMQVSHSGKGISLTGVAKACGFKDTMLLTSASEIGKARQAMHTGVGPILIQAMIGTEEVERVLPLRDGHEIKHRFMQAVQST
jgi:thiamine pyrophosphate-dependent acetolactate synthase large subunit-like protein